MLRNRDIYKADRDRGFQGGFGLIMDSSSGLREPDVGEAPVHAGDFFDQPCRTQPPNDAGDVAFVAEQQLGKLRKTRLASPTEPVQQVILPDSQRKTTEKPAIDVIA